MKQIVKALLQVQNEIKPVKKTNENSFLNYKYADINSILEQVLPILNNNKILLHQDFTTDDNNNFICLTTLTHESGEQIRNSVPMRVVKQDPQSIGSLCTYSRRYGLSAILGLTAFDDDGHSAIEWKSQDQIAKFAELLESGAFDGKRRPIKTKWRDQILKFDEAEVALEKMQQEVNAYDNNNDLDEQLNNKMEDDKS